MGLVRIPVSASRELSAVVAVMASVERPVAAAVRKYTKPVVDPVWRTAVSNHSKSYRQNRVFAQTATTVVSDRNITLKAATKGKLSNGTPASVVSRGDEFGANGYFYRNATSKKGKRYRRRTMAQFPKPNPKGYVVYPAAAEVIPRIASLWVQTTIRTVHEELEKANG